MTQWKECRDTICYLMHKHTLDDGRYVLNKVIKTISIFYEEDQMIELLEDVISHLSESSHKKWFNYLTEKLTYYKNFFPHIYTYDKD